MAKVQSDWFPCFIGISMDLFSIFAKQHYSRVSANKALVRTAPARSNFGIIARYNCFGGCVGAFLPHTAREQLHNAGVSICIHGMSRDNANETRTLPPS